MLYAYSKRPCFSACKINGTHLFFKPRGQRITSFPVHIDAQNLPRFSWSPKLFSSPPLLTTCPLKCFITSFPQPRDHLPLDSSPLFRPTNQHHQIQLSTYCLPYIRLPKSLNHYSFTLKMVTVMFVETLDNFQHSTWLIPENRSCTKRNRFIYVYKFILPVTCGCENCSLTARE
jgi:hypothetical protein